MNVNVKSFLFILSAIACLVLWIFSFPVAVSGENITPSWINAVCISSYFLFFLYCIDNKTPKHALRIAFALSFIAYYFILNWIQISMHHHAGMPLWQAQIALIMAATLVALYPALAAYVYSYCSSYASSAKQKLCFGIICFSAMELARQITPFGGFPWVMPAYALHGLDTIIQSVSYAGVLGLSVFLYIFQFCLYFTFQHRSLKSLSAVIFIPLVLVIAGSLQIKHFKSLRPKAVKVAWIQANISQDIKWTVQGKTLAMKIYNETSKQHVEEGAQVIVWPEAAVTMLYNQSEFKNRFDASYLNNSTLLFGAPSYINRYEGRYYQNSVFSVRKENALLQRTDKIHLVPFGEYVPFPFSFIEKWVPAAAGSFISASEHVLLDTPEAKFGTLICYESLFGYLSRRAVNKGADILINLTNDAWFNRSSGPYQHKIFSKFRAIETRRSLLRAANTGISTWFDATGKQYEHIGLFERGSLSADIHMYQSQSFYLKAPYTVPTLIILGLILVLIIVRKARKENLSYGRFEPK